MADEGCVSDEKRPGFILHKTHPKFSYRCMCGGKWGKSPTEAVGILESELSTLLAAQERLVEQMSRQIALAETALSYTVSAEQAGYLTSWAATAKQWLAELSAFGQQA